MTIIRLLTALAAAAVAAGAHAAGPQSEQCPIWSCRIVSPSLPATLSPDSHPISVRIGSQDIPVTEMTVIAPSTDGEIHACIRYGAFGDPEITCLLVP